MAIQSQHNFNYKYNQASIAKRMLQNIVRFSVSPCESLINIKFNKNEFLPKTADASTPTKILSYTQGLREGGLGGTSYPGQGGPEELRLSRQVLDQIFFFLAQNWTKFD